MKRVIVDNWFHRIASSLIPSEFVITVLKHRIIVLTAIIALTILFGSFIPNLLFNTSIHDLIIEDLPENAEYEAFKKIFGSEEIIRVVIKCENIYNPITFQKITQLEDKAKTIAGVRRVIGLPGIKKTVDISGNWPMEKFINFVSGAALFRHNLVSDDHRTTLLTLVLDADADQTVVIDAVKDLIDAADPDTQLYQIGMPLISTALAKFTQRDFMRLPPLTFLTIALVLLIIFRKVSYVFLPLSCIGICLIWTFGVVAILQVPLSILTMIVPVFLIAVGTAYCLHILAEYQAASQTQGSPIDATIRTYKQTSLPTLLAIATTGLGLGSLFVNRISAIREFALFACVGMAIFLILVMTYLPILISFLPIRSAPPMDKNRRLSILDRFIEWIVDLNLHHQRKALMVLLGVTLVACAGLVRLRSETNPISYFKADTEVVKNFHDIYQHLSGSFPINVHMVSQEEDYFEDATHIADLDRLQRFLDTLPGIDKAISFADYLKLINYASNQFDPAFYKLPTESWEVRMLINSLKSMLGMDVFNAFMGPSLAQSNILLLSHISSSKNFLDLRKKVLRHVSEAFDKELNWRVTGFGMVISASSHHLVTGQVKSLLLTMSVIYIIMLALFLSLKVGLIAIVPNLFPIVINFGVMGWLGIELSMAASLIASIAIGLAVDDTIHYLVRFNREFKEDLDERRALEETITHIGRPIIFTTLTIAAGFSILTFSDFKLTAIFGTMMVITMLSALVGDLILLPILIQRIELVTLWDLVRIKMGRKTDLGIPLFDGLSRAEVYSIIMAGTLKQVNAGEVIFYKGDQSESMYAVISGRFDVIEYDPACSLDSHEAIQTCVGKIGTGDILGEMGLLRSAPRSATVVATEPGELLPINWKLIQRLQWLYPPAAHKLFVNMMQILCDRVQRLTTCLASESLVDDLTGLNNRRGFIRALEQEANRAYRNQETLGMATIDVYFAENTENPVEKRKNEAILSIADTLTAMVRRCDMVSRIDTQTFAILIPGSSESNIQRIMDRLKKKMRTKQHRQESAIVLSIVLNATAIHLQADNDGQRILEKTLMQVKIRGSQQWSFTLVSTN